MLLEVGQITKPHGLKGEVIVKLSTNHDERVAPGTVLETDRGPMTIETSSPHQHGWIVRFSGMATREAAEAARGLILRAEPMDLPDELWIHEAIGSEVVDTAGVPLGRCVSVEANPARLALMFVSRADLNARYPAMTASFGVSLSWNMPTVRIRT